MRKQAFTIIELLVVIVIIGLIGFISFFSYTSYLESIKLKSATDQIVSDLIIAQSNARTEATTYAVVFSPTNYKINNKTHTLPKNVILSNRTIRFAPSGFCEPGYSGTIKVSFAQKTNRVIVSNVGRVRVE